MSKILNPKDIIEMLKKDEKDISDKEKLELNSFVIATLANDMKLIIESINILDKKIKEIESKFKN